jgi:hypothetical protein
VTKRFLPEPSALRAPETDHVWVLAPCSRPGNLGLIAENFLRQRFQEKSLLIVENGPAVGASASMHLPFGTCIITSDHNISLAKNTGLDEIRKRGGGFVAIMDDDDWYGPDYLDEAAGWARSYDVIGKNRHFLNMDGELWLCQRRLAHRRTQYLCGGTICCWAETCPNYPIVRTADDVGLCSILVNQGATLWGTSVNHYCYTRSSNADHTWKVRDLRELPFTQNALLLGPMDAAVVTGRKDVARYKVLGRHETWQSVRSSATIEEHTDE